MAVPTEIEVIVKMTEADMEEIRQGFAKLMARIEALEQEVARRPLAPITITPTPPPMYLPMYPPVYPPFGSYQPVITC